MSFRRAFVAEIRHQLAEQTESEAVARIRSYAASLSTFFGMLGLFGFLAMAFGDFSWAAAPGNVLMIAGGVLGIWVKRTVHVGSARRYGVWAAICTVLGFAEFFLIAWSRS